MITDGVNNDNYIQIYENALSSEICDEIIKTFEENKSLHNDGTTLSGLNYNMKKTKELNMSSEPLIVYDELLFKSLNDNLKKYLNKISNINMLSFDINDSGYNVQKYIANEGLYNTHHDSYTTILNNKIKTRVITYLWYLNDIHIGGETVFNDFKIKPKQGSLLLFPATWTYPHSGSMPISNDKYIITGWLSLVY